MSIKSTLSFYFNNSDNFIIKILNRCYNFVFFDRLLIKEFPYNNFLFESLIIIKCKDIFKNQIFEQIKTNIGNSRFIFFKKKLSPLSIEDVNCIKLYELYNVYSINHTKFRESWNRKGKMFTFVIENSTILTADRANKILRSNASLCAIFVELKRPPIFLCIIEKLFK